VLQGQFTSCFGSAPSLKKTQGDAHLIDINKCNDEFMCDSFFVGRTTLLHQACSTPMLTMKVPRFLAMLKGVDREIVDVTRAHCKR
jgi:hypothetical protein